MLRVASTLTLKRLSAMVVTTTIGTVGGTIIAHSCTQQRYNNKTSCSVLQQGPTCSTSSSSNNSNSSNYRNQNIQASNTIQVQDIKIEKINASEKQDDAAIVDNNDEAAFKNIRPILQASQRALRLVKTVAMIILEYKIDNYQHQLNTSLQSIGLDNFVTDRNDLKRQDLERDVQQKLHVLQEAQRIYAEPNNNTTEEDKIQNRKAVHNAAEKMSEAELVLSDFIKVSTGSNSTVHERAAIRLRDLCRINGGTYIKVGQHIANLDHLLPQAYITVLQSLFSDCPITSYDDVREVIREELGDYPEHLFQEFEEDPIASASLAQVHVAKEKETGHKLAIKVQHRGLRETSKGDLLALEYVVRVVDSLFDEFKWGWLVDEISPNLPKELDFQHEGKNAERASDNVRKAGLNCIVPKVHWNHTTSRVLCMDFEEGHSVIDIEQMEKCNVNKRKLSSLISSVFQAQIFTDGFVHCDPHPANVMWRKTKNGDVKLILLDHGLYKQIDDDFRINYASLWKALLMADIGQIQKSCSNLGIEEMYPLLSAMLMSRPFDEVIERSKTKSFRAKKIDAKSDAAMIRGYAQQYFGEIIKLLDKVPRQMLLLFKMNDCLRHIDHALDSNVNTTLVIAGKYAARAVYNDHTKKAKVDTLSSSLVNNMKEWFSFLFVMSRIRLYEIVEWWIHERKLLA